MRKQSSSIRIDILMGCLIVVGQLVLHHFVERRGMFFVMTPLNYFWQILDPAWLKSDLLDSLIYLHAQPPMLNALIGIGLKIFGQHLDLFLHIFYQVLAIGILLLIYVNLRFLKVFWWLAFGLTLVWMVYPAFIYFQHFLFYPVLVQFFLLLALTSLNQRVLNDRSSISFFFMILALLFLTRSTYNLIFIILCLFLALIFLPGQRKRVLFFTLPGLLIILGFSLKNYVLFGQLSNSSWLGMNLANVALTGLTRDELQDLVDRGEISQIAMVGAFETIDEYPGDIWHQISINCHSPDALCQLKKINNEPNLNFIGYIPVSNQMLKDDLTIIRLHPGRVLRQVMLGWRIYFSPSLVTVFVNQKAVAAIAPWAGFTNQIFCGNISNVYDSSPCYRLQFGYFSTILLGMVIIAYRIQRGEAGISEKTAMAFIFLTLLYTLFVGILFDLGENNRFRLETDPLMVIVFGYGVYHLVRYSISGFRKLKRSTYVRSN